VVWHVVKEFAAKLGVPKLALHDLRRSCARLCHAAGGELEQSISVGSRFGANNGEVSWLQAATTRSCQRPNRY
jgi:hypothetical protein